jgi:hypothetical protein
MLRLLQRSPSLLALLTSLVVSSFAQEASAKFPMEDRCFGYRVFDVNDRTVNLRQAPNGRIFRAVPNGTRVVDTYPDTPQTTPDWMPVRFQGRTVYVSKKLLYQAIYKVVDPNDRSVNIRRQPNGAVIRALPNNTEVAFVEPPRGKWTRVRLENGTIGYVATNFLKKPSCF